MKHILSLKDFIRESRLSLQNNNINEAKNVIKFPDIPNTLNFWHGGNLDDDNYQDNISHKKGRFEYGAGLYLTDSYEVVQKYTKGSRKLYLITVEKGNEISDCTLPVSKVLKFIERFVIKNKKSLVMERLSKFLDNDDIKADIFNNIILNSSAIKPSDTENLRSFLVENDVDYELTSNIGGWGGQMMVLYDMSKIVNVIKRTPKDEIESYKIKNNYLNESLNNYLTVYHGTKPKFVKSIMANGLEDKTPTPYVQGWYMVATDFESALFHAHSDDSKDFVYVIEFKIPLTDNDMWLGYPYLWKGSVMKDNSTWFALRQPLPSDFIHKIHKIDYSNWISQKNKGF